MKTALPIDAQLAPPLRKEADMAGNDLSQVMPTVWQDCAIHQAVRQQWLQLENRCLASTAQLNGWQFDRDEANER